MQLQLICLVFLEEHGALTGVWGLPVKQIDVLYIPKQGRNLVWLNGKVVHVYDVSQVILNKQQDYGYTAGSIFPMKNQISCVCVCVCIFSLNCNFK
jgi:hypothetical protein